MKTPIDEIERKWIVAKEDIPKEIQTKNFHLIFQSYLSTGEIEHRIRKDVNERTGLEKYTMAIKTGGSQTKRREWEIEIDQTTYEHLKKFAQKHIIKNRIFIEPDTTIDFFMNGKLKGEIVLEIENSDKEPPFPVLAEVTNNPKYYTANAAE